MLLQKVSARSLQEWIARQTAVATDHYFYAALVSVLCLVTVFRRNLSSNFCYVTESQRQHHLRDNEETPVINGSTKLGDICDVESKTEERCVSNCATTAGQSNFVLLAARNSEPAESNKQSVNDGKRSHSYNIFAGLPLDAAVHVMSFLHPRDVTISACVNRCFRDFVQHSVAASALWKVLWERDYGWLVTDWSVGQQALQRSEMTYDEIPFGKRFYFEFGLCYCNYLLAGHNTTDSCLVGIHGNIFDVTDFLPWHPGSPETIMAFAGRSASAMFDDVRHSGRARQRATTMCVAVDLRRLDGAACSCGVRPTTLIAESLSLPAFIAVDAAPITTSPAGSNTKAPCIAHVRHGLDKEAVRACAAVKSRSPSQNVHVYYDPMRRAWHSWYMDEAMSVVLIKEIVLP